ncbi:MAG TPA: hypothetical protein VJY35_05735 [Candidatus Eisenbacteria bacterium]|nr:hypothetical protein [Candidatus Eisenbacteria bacterium]
MGALTTDWLPPFLPLDANTPKIFGFSEFLAALALMVLAWTIADVRYRFRVRCAPIPLQELTFAVVGVVGVLSLLTDVWRAEQRLVPQGSLITPSEWQALLGALFFLTFMAWAWFAFIRPPVFSPGGAKRYARTLYAVILKGSPAELSVVADEFKRSVRPLIRWAPDRSRRTNSQLGDGHRNTRRLSKRQSEVAAFANDLLLLIADRRFCRAIVESSPGTALAVFSEVGETRKYGVDVATFARNIVAEALANKNSFLFHEAEGYESGLIGYHKPLSQAMFSNHAMVETIGTLLDPPVRSMWSFDADQWEAYCRVVLITLKDYVEEGFWTHSTALYRAKGYIERAAADLYKLDGLGFSSWDDDVRGRLRVVVGFIKAAVDILEKGGVPGHVRRRVPEQHHVGTFYDHLSDLIFEVISSASTVTRPGSLCWGIQHNAVWSELFNFKHLDGPAGRIVKFKVRRLIYDEVVDMGRFPNFLGARILGFCLNVMGLSLSGKDYDRDSVALQKAILSWTRKNYAWLHSYNPRVAEACLVDSMTYDPERHRITKTYPADVFTREAQYVHFEVDPPRT